MILGLNQMIEKRGPFQSDPRIDVWLVSQVELEHLRLIRALDTYHHTIGPAEADLGDLLTRFDIFWSRLLVINEGRESERLREVAGLEQTVGEVTAVLDNIEPEIATLQKADRAAYQSILSQLTDLSAPIHSMVLDTTNHNRGLRIETASARSDIFWQVVGYFIGILVSGTILVLFLLWQNREARRLLARAAEAERRAKEASTHLIHAIESFTDGFALYDQDGRLQIWNERFLTSYPKIADYAVSGRTVDQLSREGYLRGQFRQIEAGIEEWVREQNKLYKLPESFFEQRLSDGRWLHVKGRRTSDGFNAVIYTDVTEMKQREAELAENSKRLELALEKEVELSSMKSNFVATASHEFRTPLTTIFSAADLLQHYSDQMDEAEKLDYLEEIKQEVGEMTQLLDDILLVRKMEAGMFSFSPEKANFETLLRNIVRASQNLAGNLHAIKLNIECDGNNVSIDSSLIRHIVNNLLSNAIKYSPDGSPIEVSLSRGNGELILDVVDNGIGIAENEIDRVFDTFFRAENSAGIGGTGLGLSVVKTAVELHGGRISVESVVNEGTTFSVRIPDSTD
ncbi:MAG: ATP-binding protein [Proteobacteria bacterium]|nr:ATP-binding protein [Pseudomonadota bacterium]MDA1356634.1 ATP-binding protein [Pseudomonadota bacterium]